MTNGNSFCIAYWKLLALIIYKTHIISYYYYHCRLSKKKPGLTEFKDVDKAYWFSLDHLDNRLLC